MSPEVRAENRWRQIVSIVLIVLGVLATPVAVVGAWARSEIVETDGFVATLAPLASHPDVQTLVVDQVVAAVEERAALPAALHEPLRGFVADVVASPAFAALWERVVRAAHAETVAVLTGQASAVDLSDDGTLSLRLGVVVDAVRDELADRGNPIAPLIPAVDHTVVIVHSEALPQVRAGYALAATLGWWLPVIALALLGAGILFARRRARTLAWTGLALAVVLLSTGLVLAAAPGLVADAAGLDDGAGVAAVVAQVVATPRAAMLGIAGAAVLIAAAAAWAARRGMPWGRKGAGA